MVIVIKNADFSANNIGQIQVPRELNEFTLNAITLSGNESMTDEQKKSLDVFFENIGAFGSKSNIWSKLDKVYLPMICTALNKSCVNYITGNTDAVPDSTWLELRNHGIGRIENATKGQTLIVDNNYVWNWGNKCAFAFNTSNLNNSNMGVRNYRSGTGYDASQAQSLSLKKNSLADNADYTAWSKANVSLLPASGTQTNAGIGVGLKGVSSNGTKAIIYGYPANTDKPTSVEVTIESSAIQYFDSLPRDLMISSANTGDWGNCPSEGAIILGEYLTQSECETLGSAFNELWAAFNV